MQYMTSRTRAAEHPLPSPPPNKQEIFPVNSGRWSAGPPYPQTTPIHPAQTYEPGKVRRTSGPVRRIRPGTDQGVSEKSILFCRTTSDRTRRRPCPAPPGLRATCWRLRGRPVWRASSRAVRFGAGSPCPRDEPDLRPRTIPMNSSTDGDCGPSGKARTTGHGLARRRSDGR